MRERILRFLDTLTIYLGHRHLSMKIDTITSTVWLFSSKKNVEIAITYYAMFSSCKRKIWRLCHTCSSDKCKKRVYLCHHHVSFLNYYYDEVGITKHILRKVSDRSCILTIYTSKKISHVHLFSVYQNGSWFIYFCKATMK